VNPYVILCIQLLLSGGNYIIANSATQTIPPVNLTFLRTVISGIIYLLYMFYAGLPFKYKGRDLTLLLFLSLLSVSLNQLGFLYGMKYTTATEGALLYAITPVIVLFLSRAYLKEKITFTRIVGAILAFAGVVIIVLSKGSLGENGTRPGSTHLKGDLLIFMAVIAWAIYTALGRKLVVKYGAINSTVFTALIGSAMFAPVGIWTSVGYNYLSLTSGQWMEVLYLSLGTSIAGYVLWYYALSKIEASKVAVFTNGQPVVTAILAYVFLGQGITLTFALAALVTISGVVITQLDFFKKRSVAKS